MKNQKQIHDAIQSLSQNPSPLDFQNAIQSLFSIYDEEPEVFFKRCDLALKLLILEQLCQLNDHYVPSEPSKPSY